MAAENIKADLDAIATANRARDAVVRDLLVLHYDPTYAASMLRNFTHTAKATPLSAVNRQPESLRQVASALLTLTEPR